MELPDAAPGWQAVPDDPLERDPHASVGWDVMLWVALALVAASLLFTVVMFFTGALDVTGQGEPTQDEILVGRIALYVNVLFNAVLFGLVPILWVAGTRRGGRNAIAPFFSLTRPAPNIAWGLLGGVLMAGAVIGVFYVGDLLGFQPEESALDRQLGALLTVPLAILISLQAGITEEILFRGLIQRRVGWIAQAPIFGLFHLTQGWIGVVATTLIGLLFGFLVHRRISMYAVMAAHFSYDMVLLGIFLAS